MLAAERALAEIVDRVHPLEEIERIPLAQAVGRVLARDVVSDIDLPPFEKSAMDGYAVHTADFAPDLAPEGERSLPVLGESRAGDPWRGELPRGACVAIYTGAEVPAGCDAVVVVEKSEPSGEGPGREDRSGPLVKLRDRPRPMQNICNRGQDLAQGATVLRARRRLRAVDLAVLAAVGCEPVPAIRRPRVSVVTSGDELVAPQRTPGPGQIREGNTLFLAALLASAGAEVQNLGIAPDERGALARAFAAALSTCDALVTTGGVSMGRYDMVGGVLEGLGIEPVFHKVAIKPGKPLWFGTLGRVPVFALPGNPVSCLVNHELFVRPAIERLGGAEPDPERERPLRGRWAGGELGPNERERWLPVEVSPREDGSVALEPVRWQGSADVVGISRARALARVPAGRELGAGDPLVYRRLL